MKLKELVFWLKGELALYLSNITAYFKYQLITKSVLFLAVFPLLYKLGELSLRLSGHIVFSSGNIKQFMFSLPSIVFFIIAVAVLLLAMVIDINAFIFISVSAKKINAECKSIGKADEKNAEKAVKSAPKISVVEALRRGVGSVRSFFSPAGAFLLVYTALIVPLVGVGLKSSIIKSLKIPNFISSVIYDTPLYLAIYLFVIVSLALVGFFLLFCFHFMQIRGDSAVQSIRGSIKTAWENKGFIISSFILLNVFLFLFSAGAIALMHLIIEGVSGLFAGSLFLSRFSLVFVLMLFAEIINLLVFLVWPLQIQLLTSIFLKFNAVNIDEYKGAAEVTKPKRPSLSRRLKLIIFIGAVLFVNIAVSAASAVFFDALFRCRPALEIVAHRGGGSLAAENTILGLNAGARAGAGWSEIDVMRSKDGVYIINHDKTFQRLAGVNKAPSEMLWEEIRQLKIKDSFNAEGAAGSVPDLDSLMDEARGKIGLFIELKGADADKKMADYVVNAIHEREMLDEAVIISLDYDIIQYIEENYPEIKTGYLYFFSLGDVSRINTDFLIMEESAVKPSAIEKIHSRGKKAFVWTVNKPEALKGLIDAEVDGVITDSVLEIKDAIRRFDQKTDKDMILDEIKSLLSGE